VAEVTIAGRLQDIFAGLVAANDLRLRRGMDSPSVRITEMTLAGS
jgi:PmbA protein